MFDYINQLNDSQREAVEYCSGASLVIAGAGSGKTRMLTYKIAYLLERGMKPWQILALTFTNKAANEMRERVSALVGYDQARYLNMGTFHSVFSHILRNDVQAIGYMPNFTIYDETDSRSLIKHTIKALGLDDKQYKPSTVGGVISMAKNQLVTAQMYASNRNIIKRDSGRRMPSIYKIYEAYQAELMRNNAMDFDDLLLNTYLMFLSNEEIRQKYADRFQYVLVDEYQDTNYAQQQIIWQLTCDRQRVCVVGDDAQSIYAFRGANIDNILNFQDVYDDCRLFKLERNYRSTKNIVNAANSLIKSNTQQIPKDIYSENKEGEKLIIHQVYSDKEEAAVVCKYIEHIKSKEHIGYNDFAILYRTNAQSRTFEEQMRKENIPYRIFGGLSFYQRKEIKDILAYFRLVCNNHDSEALRRIINYPARGIGATTLEKITSAATQNNMTLWEVIDKRSLYLSSLSKATQNKIGHFKQMIDTFANYAQTMNAAELGMKIIEESGIKSDISSDITPEGIARKENVQEFVNAINEFVHTRTEEGEQTQIMLADYLQEVTLISDLDSDDNTDENRVTLMTIHSAKGLEFPTVFVVGVEENILPSPMSSNSLRELEEERRLLYVAITRAERHCILTTAASRYRYGRMEFGTPSRFIADLDKRFVTIVGKSQIAKPSFRHYYFDDNDTYKTSRRQQNSRPVASQFMADPKPKITHEREKEQAVNPFSNQFRQQLERAGANLQRIDTLMTKGNRTLVTPELSIGMTIEHDRFGIGKVIEVEGKGENTKATVEFQNVGRKQLLLKFAKYKIVENNN